MRLLALLSLFFFYSTLQLSAQRFLADSSHVRFFSQALLEDIEATNSQGQGVIDIKKGEFAFSIPIKSFQFEKSLMQEHFNENYMESEKYPKATFHGKMLNFSEEVTDWQEVEAEGELEIHGVKRKVKLPAQFLLNQEGKVSAKSSFKVKLKDHKIKVPRMLFQNIAEIIDVDVFFIFSPYEK